MNKRFYTIKEISEYLGFAENTIRKWIRNGEVPHFKLNGGIRFDIQQIDKWVLKKYRQPVNS